MAHGDNPADRYNHRAPGERDQERPIGEMPERLRGVTVDSSDTQRGDIEHFDAADERDQPRRGVLDHGDRAGGGGAPDHGAGDPGGTLGTQGGRREQDQ